MPANLAASKCAGCLSPRRRRPTRPSSRGRSLWKDHKELLRRVERTFGFKGVEHFGVETGEGLGVLHLLWAWQPRPGRRGVAFYIPQAWLSRTWAEIHGAPMVWVTR